MVRGKIEEGLAAQHVPMPRAERQEMVDELVAEVLGYGPIEEFLRDPTITEVMVNGYRDIYIERGGKILKTDKRFRDEGHFEPHHPEDRGPGGPAGRRVVTLVDARLPDGSRVNVILPPLVGAGPGPDHPEVLRRSLHHGRPDRIPDAHPAGRRLPARPACSAG